MAFDVEQALRDGYTQEQIDAYIQQNNITPKPIEEVTEEVTEEVITAPTPQPSPEPTQKTFNVEQALRDGYTQEQIDKHLKLKERKKTFNVEQALRDGYTQEQINTYLLEGPERAGFFEAAFGTLGDQFDMADVGLSTILPGGKDANQAAAEQIKQQQTEPQGAKFSYAAIENAFKRGGIEGVKELVLQLPGGAGTALGAIGPSIAAGIAGGVVGGPIGALVAIAAASFLPNLGGNVIEQAGADIAEGRPLDIEVATAVTAALAQAGIDVVPFKVSKALKKLVGIKPKVGPELTKKIAEQGLTKAIGKDAVGIIAAELPAEISQEIIQKYQAGVDPFTPEAMAEYKEVGAVVALTGGLGVYTGPKTRSQARRAIEIEETEKAEKDFEDENKKDPRGKKVKSILDDEKGKIKVEEEEASARKISRTKLTTINEEMLKDLGISPKTNAGKELLGKDITDLDNIEMIERILDNENLTVKSNKKAVENFKRKLKRDRKKILKAQKEALNEESTLKGKRTRARDKLSNKSKSVVTTGTGSSDTNSMDTNQSGAGESVSGARISDDTLKKVRAKAKKDSEILSPYNRGFVDSERAIEQHLGKEAAAEYRRLVDIESKRKVEEYQKKQKSKRKKQKAVPKKTTDFSSSDIRKEQEKQFADAVVNASEKELNEAGFESYIDIDKDGNETKKYREIKTKKPLFAKEPTDTEKKLTEIRKRKKLAIETFRNQTEQDGGIPSPAYRKPIIQLQQMEDELVKQDSKEKKEIADQKRKDDLPPEQQELFSKTEESIPDTGETQQSIMGSFVEEFGNNVNLGVRRGILNIVDTVANLPSSIPNLDSLPANVKAIYFDGKAYFIADRITKEDAPRMLLHEIGAHYGLEGMLGKANYDRTVKSLRSKKESDKEIKAAFDYVRDNYPELNESSNDFIQEVIANIAEDSPQNTVFRKIVGYIKNFLSKLGMGWDVDNISVAQIQDMVQHSVRVALSQPEVSSDTKASLASKDENTAGNIFYSPLEKAINNQKMEKMPIEDWKVYLIKRAKKQGFTNQLDATGILDWLDMLQRRKDILDKNLPNAPIDIDGFDLDNRGRLSKSDILAWLGQYDITVVDVIPEGPLTESEIENMREERREYEKSGYGEYERDNLREAIEAEAGFVDDSIPGVFRVFGSQNRDADPKYTDEPYMIFVDKNLLDDEKEMTPIDVVASQTNEGTIIDRGPVQAYINLAKEKGWNIEIIDEGPYAPARALEEYRTGEDQAYDYLYEIHNPQIEKVDKKFELVYNSMIEERVDNYIREVIEDNEQRRYAGMQRTEAQGDVFDSDDTFLPQEYFEIILSLDNTGTSPKYGSSSNIFESSHWEGVNNPILHIRADIRYDSKNNRVLFVEEVQSDWAEKIRKGYYPELAAAFVEDTQLWTKLAVKRIIRLAAEQDVDKVAFLNSEQALINHNRSDKGADYYNTILPSVARKTINNLENTSRQELETIVFKPRYKPDNKTLDLLFEIFNTRDLNPTTQEEINKFLELRTKLTRKLNAIYPTKGPISFEWAYGLAKTLSEVTNLERDYIHRTEYETTPDLLNPATRDEAKRSIRNELSQYQLTKNRMEAAEKKLAALKRENNLLRIEINRFEALLNKETDPFKSNDMRQELKRLYNEREKIRDNNSRLVDTGMELRRNFDAYKFEFLRNLLEKNIIIRPELTNEHKGFTLTPRLKKVAEAGMPLFAKQGSKTRKQLMQEIEDGKTNKEKLNDKRKKVGKKTDDPADPFYKSNKTLGEKVRGFQNGVFGYDIGLYNKLKDEIVRVSKSKSVQESKKFIEDTLAKISIAQAVHAETLAGAFKQLGGIVFNPTIEKFEIIQDANNLKSIEKKVRQFAETNFKKGLVLTQDDVIAAEKFISQAITALQFKRIVENNKKLEADARLLVRQGKEAEAKKVMEGYILVDQTEAQLDAMTDRFNQYPELKEIQQSWIGVKNNVLQFLLESEVIDQEQFDAYTLEGGVIKNDVFIPLYREGQPDVPRSVRKGTKSGKGIFVPRRGSIEPVDNVFSNMNIFVQAGITQGIANKTALQKIRTAQEVQLEDALIVRPTAERTPGFEENAVEVSEIDSNGKQKKQLYEYSNVMYANATNGAAKAMDMGNVFANASTLLRDQIVLNPVFGVAQTFIQDMYSAMYTSGLRYGWLIIPLRVLKEFPLTILNLSSTHNKLSKFGAVGGYAFKQNDNTIDSDINAPGFYNALIRRLSRIPGTNLPTGLTQAGAIRVGDTKLSIGGLLNRIAMASDNSVRQAVYEQALLENKSQRRALEMAFEIINFRKTGDHKIVTAARQYIPFFGAALQALSVQGKVIQGLVKQQSGVTPTDLKEARINFFITWAGTAGITLLYNILMDDEEDKIIESFSPQPMSKELKKQLRDVRKNFGQLDNKIRDRRFIIGDDGFHLTLRPDFFTYIGKIIPEQTYQTIIAENQDAAKFWTSIKRNLREIVSLNLIPQLVRPLVDVYYNQDSRTGRPIIPRRMEELTPEMQSTPGTSEAAKKIGGIIGYSPILVDYFFRQYTGYTGGLVSMLSDAYFLEADTNPLRKNRPAKTTRDQIASFPGMTNFFSRDKDNRFMSDFYELKNKTSQVAAIFNALNKSPNPEDGLKAQKFLNEGNNQKLYDANQRIEVIQNTLTKIRQRRQNIYDQPANAMYDGRLMTDEFKRLLLKDLDRQEVNALDTIHNIRVGIYGTNPFYKKDTEESFPGFDMTDLLDKGS